MIEPIKLANMSLPNNVFTAKSLEVINKMIFINIEAEPQSNISRFIVINNKEFIRFFDFQYS